MIKPNVIYDFDGAKEKYRLFCESQNNDIQIFAQPWFLDAACDASDDWRVIVYEENGKVTAAFPFQYHHVKGKGWCIDNPFQVARLGLWLNYGNREAAGKRETFENQIVQYVIDRLPPYDTFDIKFDARFTNWQQFYRNGFHQTTRYSYLIRGNGESLLSRISSGCRNEIRTAEKSHEVITIQSIDHYWALFDKSYKNRKRISSYSEQRFKRLAEAVLSHHSGQMYLCQSRDTKEPSAISFVFFDKQRCYNMFNTFFESSSRSTQPLCTYQSIYDALAMERIFDFEGSMIPGVARYNNQKFNAVQEPYYHITKQSYPIILKQSLHEALRALYHLIKERKGTCGK